MDPALKVELAVPRRCARKKEQRRGTDVFLEFGPNLAHFPQLV
jgi:hypothetical protein